MSRFTINEHHVLELDDQDDYLVLGRRVCLQSCGYARVGRQYVHRLVTGARKGTVVDHIDGNRLNCKRANLRIGTKAQNGFNRGKASHNTTGFKGVSLCKATGRFRAEIRANRIRHKLGRFQQAEDAARAYDAAARRLHGAFAQLNFTDPNDFGAVGRGCDQ